MCLHSYTKKEKKIAKEKHNWLHCKISSTIKPRVKTAIAPHDMTLNCLTVAFQRLHKPPAPLNVGTPLSALTPAPVNITRFLHFLTRS